MMDSVENRSSIFRWFWNENWSVFRFLFHWLVVAVVFGLIVVLGLGLVDIVENAQAVIEEGR